MHVTMTFNLPEDQDLYEYYSNAMKYRQVIDDFRNMLRAWEKSGANHPVTYIRDEFGKLLERISYD